MKILSTQFNELAKSAANDRIKYIVAAIGRNFKNFSSNLEIMSYDLLTEAKNGFDSCKEETARELHGVK